MIFDNITVGPLGVNCIILGCKHTKEALVIDPGGDVDMILARLAVNKLSLTGIINTHGHFDHVGGNKELINSRPAPLWIHKADAEMLSRVAEVANMYGLSGENSPEADFFLEHGQEINFGQHKLKVIHTPGHTQGCCCLYQEAEQLLISGDTLFADGVGRTDLPGGSYEQLAASIKTRLFVLPEKTVVWPGHGSSTTIGHEIRHNPYLD